MALAGCGTSPDFVDEPAHPEAVQEQDWDGATPMQDGRPECVGTTGATRMQGRQDRHTGVEGFSSRGCNSSFDDKP
jgi:hypothetical protein